MSNIAISIKGLSKRYSIGKKKDGSLRGSMANIFNRKASTEEFWALKDVSFDIQKGDVVGIIGKNGAGKSTLLKILSQITKPSEGEIEINGRVASLLEVGTGFHPELTGRENVYLNGTILGMTRKEVTAKFDEIVEFSGVEKFIDTPVKHYSSGMYVRLAFAVAAHLEPEILIIDEVLAVGDAEFQKKCLGKMKDVAGEGRTVLFVSHHLNSVKSLCSSGVLLAGGQIVETGSVDDVVKTYQGFAGAHVVYYNHAGKSDIFVSKAEFDRKLNKFYHSEEIELTFEVTNRVQEVNEKRILVRVIDSHESVVFSTETKLTDASEYHLKIMSNFLVKGVYKLNTIIYHPAVCQYENIGSVLEFEILDNNVDFSHLETFDIGVVYSNSSWVI